MADFLDAKVREIEERLQELRPLIEEFHRLEAASAALGGVSAAGASVRRRSTPSIPPVLKRRPFPTAVRPPALGTSCCARNTISFEVACLPSPLASTYACRLETKTISSEQGRRRRSCIS